VVKGVMSPKTAMEAVERGIDAVYVSKPWRTRAGRRAGGDHRFAAGGRCREGTYTDHL
jgi:hypothetical protein